MSILSELMCVDLIPLETILLGPPSSQLALGAMSAAGELPEVMDTLIKRYQSLYL